MTTARAAILARIRAGLPDAGKGERPPAPPQVRAGPIPAGVPLDPAGRLTRFMEMAQAASAGVERLPSLDALPKAIDRFRIGHGLGPKVLVGADPQIQAVEWSSSGLIVQGSLPEEAAEMALSVAHAAIAETGSVMLVSGPENPSTLNFLPTNHLVIVPTARLVGTYEEAWRALRRSSLSLPRTVNLITGPSRSADIEQRLLMGAHGPLRLQLFVLDHLGG